VVVADLVAFMRNFDPSKAEPDNLIKPGMKTKNELLAYVRKIDLVYPSTIEPTYRDFCAGDAKCWNNVARMVDYQQLSSKEEVKAQKSEYFNVQGVRDKLFSATKGFNPFSNLERMVIGGSGSGVWADRRVARNRLTVGEARVLQDMLNDSSVASLLILSASHATHGCIHAAHGPFITPTNRIYRPENSKSLRSFTSYLQESLTKPGSDERDAVQWPTIICGTNNRWVADQPSVRYNVASAGTGESLQLIAQVLEQLYEHYVKDDIDVFGHNAIDLADTTIEIYAFQDLRPLSVPGLGRFVMRGNGESYNEEEKLLEDAQRYLDYFLLPIWKGKVELKLSYKAPDCECCGYKVKQFVSLFTLEHA
jgi:hypothetical protein